MCLVYPIIKNFLYQQKYTVFLVQLDSNKFNVSRIATLEITGIKKKKKQGVGGIVHHEVATGCCHKKTYVMSFMCFSGLCVSVSFEVLWHYCLSGFGLIFLNFKIKYNSEQSAKIRVWSIVAPVGQSYKCSKSSVLVEFQAARFCSESS